MLLISQNFLKYIKKVNDNGVKSDKAVQPLQWDPSQEKFIPPNETAKYYLAIHAFVGYLISLIHFYHAIGLGPPSKPEVSKSMEVSFKCQNFLFSSAFSAGASFYLVMLLKGEGVADLINGLIQMESKFRKYCDFNLENDEDKTFLKKIKLTFLFNFYRQLQIFSQLFGEIHRFILAQFLFTVVISQVTCIYLLVKFSNAEELKGMERVAMSGFYATAGLDTMLVIFVMYGFMADLHHRSELVKENLLEVNAFKRKFVSTRLVQKLTKSCPTLKISIGASNYLEKTSPLKFEDQIFVAVANLLLMQ